MILHQILHEKRDQIFLAVNRPALELAGAGRKLILASSSDAPSLMQLMASGVRLLWVAAHPDDEILAAPLLAASSLFYQNPSYFLVFTHGEGGECSVPDGCNSDVAVIRGKEMQQAAQLYHAELRHEYFYNAHLPLESFPKRHEIAATWLSQGDPARVIAEVIRKFRPDLLLTLAPEFGYTGHIEHQLASRFAMVGIRLAAEPAFSLGLSPHRISHTYFLLNKYWFMKLWGRGYDPRPWTDMFDVRLPCSGNRTGSDIMRENIEIHRSQPWDMAAFRRLSNIIHHLFLYRADPYQEIKDPFEPQEHSKFGLHRIKFHKDIDGTSEDNEVYMSGNQALNQGSTGESCLAMTGGTSSK